MRVLQINSSSEGSTGSVVCSISEFVNNHGDEGYIAYGIGGRKSKYGYKVSGYLETHLHDRLAKLTGLQGYYSLFHTIRLIAYIHRIDPDIIHLHNLHGNYLCLPLLFNYLSKKNKRIIITLHDCWLFTGKCPHFTDVSCLKWQNGCGKCSQLSIYPKSYCFDRTRKCLKDKKRWIQKLDDPLIIPVSDWLKKTAECSYLREFRMVRVYNGVDVRLFHPNGCVNIRNKYKIGDKFVILGVASVWHIRKGFSEFIELAGMLREDEMIIMVGLTSAQIWKLPSNVVGIGHTENKEELVGIYSTADVFFNASTEETFGLVVAEAAACGTPSVVYHSTACDEILTKDVGISVSPHDVKAAYAAIESIRQQRKSHYSKKNIELVEKCYTNDIMSRNYYDLYVSELKRKQGIG